MNFIATFFARFLGKIFKVFPFYTIFKVTEKIPKLECIFFARIPKERIHRLKKVLGIGLNKVS